MSAVQFTSASLEQALAGPVPVLADFWAPWCMPCRAMEGTVEELARSYGGRITVGKVNTDEEPDLVLRFRVAVIPTLVLFRCGEEVLRLTGVQDAAALRSALDRALAS